MKITIGIYLIFFINLSVNAQKHIIKNTTNHKSTPIKNLKIGDTVPDILIAKIINDKQQAVKTSDFDNKLLILDFWATSCSSCVEALPKLMNLQDKFGDKIKILPITYESEVKTRVFLQRNKHTKKLTIPTVVEDKVLSKWFRHMFISHDVWIYKGKIVAITGSEYVDEASIELILNGNNTDLPVKDDFRPSLPAIDYGQPLLKINGKNNMAENKLIKYAGIFGYIEGSEMFKEGISYDTGQNLRRNYIINSSVLFAYQNNLVRIGKLLRLPVEFLLQPNRVILEVKNPDNYYNTHTKYAEKWTKDHFYCFELVSVNDEATELEQRKMIIKGLNYLLDLNGRVEKRKIRCFSLVRTSFEDKLKSAGAKSELVDDEPIKKIRNMYLKSFVEILNKNREMPPVFDETGYEEAVDMDLELDSWNNIPQFKKNLQKYGLDLKEREQELDMFVLTELNSR